jgi:hypothetical protein
MSRRSSWPCATEPPPRAVPKVNWAPSSSTFEAASPVPAAIGHEISSAPHRRASPDRWTPHRPLRRHPRPHFCPIGTVSPPADRRCRHEGSLVSAPPPRCPKWAPTSPAISPTHGPTSPRRCSPDPATAVDHRLGSTPSPVLLWGCRPEPSRPSCWTRPKQQWMLVQ